jgi:hypothetical protein
MNAAVIYRALDGTLAWVIVRPALVEACKIALRKDGLPAIAVIRRKTVRTELYD